MNVSFFCGEIRTKHKNMKILHIGNLKSGIDTYVRNTVALANDDFEFVIVNSC